MKGQPLLGIALLLTTTLSGFGNSPSEEAHRDRLKALRTDAFSRLRLTPLDRAYLDARELLTHDNTCSQFYGGNKAERVLDELTIRLRPRSIRDSRIGIEMSGSFTYVVDQERAISYRLFEKAEINSSGPFYTSLAFRDGPPVPRIGSFAPDTREARVVILLHELAHLIRGNNKTWLIPDDGNNPLVSRQNTALVESRCGELIRAL